MLQPLIGHHKCVYKNMQHNRILILLIHLRLQGGMKAVVITDVFQAVIMLIGMFIVLIKVINIRCRCNAFTDFLT